MTTSRGLAYDKRKLQDLEHERKHVQSVLDKAIKDLADVKAGRRNITMAKQASLTQAKREAEEQLYRVTKEIVHVKKMIAREEQKNG